MHIYLIGMVVLFIALTFIAIMAGALSELLSFKELLIVLGFIALASLLSWLGVLVLLYFTLTAYVFDPVKDWFKSTNIADYSATSWQLLKMVVPKVLNRPTNEGLSIFLIPFQIFFLSLTVIIGWMGGVVALLITEFAHLLMAMFGGMLILVMFLFDVEKVENGTVTVGKDAEEISADGEKVE